MTGPAELTTAVSAALLATNAGSPKDYPGTPNTLTGTLTGMSMLTVVRWR